MLSSNTSAVSGDTTYIEDVFSTYLYTGNGGSSQTITNNIDLSAKGGLVWGKVRTNVDNHYLFDTVRGVNQGLSTNSTAAQGSSGVSAFSTTGFTVDTNLNSTSARTFASWTFRKQPKFFDVVTYTGDGAASKTISHNLGSTPGCIITKRTDTAGEWWSYHTSLGNNKTIRLNSTAALTDAGADLWGVTSTTFTASSTVGANTSAGTYVAYIFAHDAGGFGLTGTDNVISCGSFDAASVTTTTLGYEPQFLMFKRTDTTGNWRTVDNMRGWPNSGNPQELNPNLSAAETSNGGVNLIATGFTNVLGTGTYIYIAIRRGPMKVPTDATKVFAPLARTGTATDTTITTPNFVTDLVITQNRQANANPAFFDRLRGATKGLYPNGTGAEFTSADGLTGFDTMTGYKVGADQSQGTINFSPWTYANWNFRRAPSFFDEVCYTGNGTSGLTVTHNLKAVPELMIVKSRSPSAGNWQVYNAAKTATDVMYLNTTNASFADSGAWANTAPTSSVFSVGANGDCNDNNGKYVAYLFATCAGVSKVGSYTGNGSTQAIDCGFAAGARFVLIKRTDSTGDWYVWDTARGIVSGNDPYLLLNSTAAEMTITDFIDPISTGFELSSTALATVNVSGGTYIFLAIA